MGEGKIKRPSKEKKVESGTVRRRAERSDIKEEWRWALLSLCLLDSAFGAFEMNSEGCVLMRGRREYKQVGSEIHREAI